jgi:hypothetical protein
MKTAETKEQMELRLELRAKYRNSRGKKPARRAGWWFSQMRRAVDRAMDWTPRPIPRANQVYFSMERQTESPNW